MHMRTVIFLYGKNVIVNSFALDIDILKCIFYEYVRFVCIKNSIFIYLSLSVSILHLHNMQTCEETSNFVFFWFR